VDTPLIWDTAMLQYLLQNAMQPIAKTVLASPAASISFTNIPQNFNSIFIVGNVKSALTSGSFVNDSIRVQFNGVVAANYNYTDIYNQSSSSASAFFGNAVTSSDFANVWTSFTPNTAGAGGFLAMIPAYTQTTFNKSIVAVSYASDGGGTSILALNGGAAQSANAAVSQLTFLLNSASNMVTGSYIGLYGC
jgi:hypothetical protein